MDYEKKYKEALSRAKVFELPEYKKIAESIFPELAESEDERIRKALICGMYALKEQHKTCFASIPIDNAIAWLEKQGEQKPIDKVEPKFKVGDWILYSGDHYEGVRHITKIDENGYYIERNGLPHGIIPFEHEICMRLWTIQDAKDGDVLAESKGDVILMFRGIGNARWDDVIDYHFYYDCYRENFIVQEDVNYWGDTENNQLKPATKEQRDLLSQKMKESDYKWDAEKKELKKIEQKPTDDDMKEALRTEYEKGRSDAIVEMQKPVDCIDCTNSKGCINCEDGNMKETLVQKPAWTEADEKIGKDLIDFCIKCSQGDTVVNSQDDFAKWATWLKSLKERYTWKPSDEQIKVCKEVYADILSAKGFDLGTVNGELNRLEEQLSKIYKD